MTATPISGKDAGTDAHDFVAQLVRALEGREMDVVVLEPSTRLRVQVRHAPQGMAEMICLMPDADERLRWWWSWGDPICLAGDIEYAARVIAGVCAVRP